VTTAGAWEPDAAAETRTLSAATTVGGVTLPAGFAATKPDWSKCQVRWKGGFAEAKGCGDGGSDGCNGSNAVATVDAGSGRIVFDLTKPMAMPAVTVRFADSTNISTNGRFVQTAIPTGSDAPGAVGEWGFGTWLIPGNATVDSDVFFGIGMNHAQFASMVVKGNLVIDGGSSAFFAGSLFVLGNMTLSSGSYSNGSGSRVNSTRAAFNGLVTVGGNLDVANSSRFFMDYDEDLAGVSDLRAMPSMGRTVR
jgi:hypothetical protein